MSSGTAARRKIESPSVGHNDDYRQIDAAIGPSYGQSSSSGSSSASAVQLQQQNERKSVFERLGPITAPIARATETRRVLTRDTYDDSVDLRFKVRRNRHPLSPVICTSPSGVSTVASGHSPSPVSALSLHKHRPSSSSQRTDDTKVKSLVLNPHKRTPSPLVKAIIKDKTRAPKRVSAKDKRTHIDSKHSSDDNDGDDDDDEALNLRLQQLQKELRELDDERTDIKCVTESTVLSVVGNTCSVRSRSISTLSSSSSSCTLTNKTLSKSNSCCSINDTHKSDHKHSPNEKVLSHRNQIKSKIDVHHQQVSNPIGNARKLDNVCDNTRRNEVKLDRHGNVRVSLDEQERQKRIRAERFGQKRMSPDERPRKRTDTIEDRRGVNVRERSDRSRSPPSKRSKDISSSVERKDNDKYRHRETDSNKSDRTLRNDDYHSNKIDSRNRYDHSRRSRTPPPLYNNRSDNEQIGERKNRYTDDGARSRDGNSDTYHDDKRDHIRDNSKFGYDRDYLTVGYDKRRTGDGPNSREHSPAHSFHSKFSRASSMGSDHSSHLSKCGKFERTSHKKSIVKETGHNSQSNVLSVDNNFDAFKVNADSKAATSIDEMSPISALSSLPEIGEIDSNSSKRDTKDAEELRVEKDSMSDDSEKKNDDESDATFSDWSEGEDELLMRNDGFETIDETGNLSDSTQEKDTWNDNAKVHHNHDSQDVFSSSPRDDDTALEAISDDELDAIIGESETANANSQQSNARQQMLDALEIDWGSLITESRTKPEAFVPKSARKRFSPANVLSRIGFSHAFVGTPMREDIIGYCKNKLKEDFVPFKHSIASIHSLINERIKERRYLSQSDTTHVTALSGRKDLLIKKMFNKSLFKTFESATTALATQHQQNASSNININNNNNTNEYVNSPINSKDCIVNDVQC